MNVGIIGSGGREHAITFSLSKSKKIGKIFCTFLVYISIHECWNNRKWWS